LIFWFFFFPPNKPFSRIDILFQNLLVLSNMNFYFFLQKKKALSSLAFQRLEFPASKEMRSVLTGSSLVLLGGPSRAFLRVAVSPGERGSPLRSRELCRSSMGEQSSSSCPLTPMGRDGPRDGAVKRSAQPHHPGRNEPGESRSPHPPGPGR